MFRTTVRRVGPTMVGEKNSEYDLNIGFVTRRDRAIPLLFGRQNSNN